MFVYLFYEIKYNKTVSKYTENEINSCTTPSSLTNVLYTINTQKRLRNCVSYLLNWCHNSIQRDYNLN